MRITYDPAVDVLYIELRPAVAEDSVDLEGGVTADLDGSGHIIGIEFLDAQARLGTDALATVALERLPLAAANAES